MTIQPQSVEQVQQAIAEHDRVTPVGRRTKSSLPGHRADDIELDLTLLQGISEYEPNEFVFSAMAGTSLETVNQTLAAHGQYLPFDPPWVAAGATLGGTVASGISGSCRLRYGAVRDFLIGVRLVDGLGRVVSAGGKVVKNAAGFDLSKLVVGSLGTLGVLTELTFKVFPSPQHRVTVVAHCRDLDDALQTMSELAAGAWDLEALDLEPPATLQIRLAGHAGTLETRAAALREAISRPVDVLDDEAERAYWNQQSEFDWVPAEAYLVKVPLTAAKIPRLEQELSPQPVTRRYSVAGNVAWLSWPAHGSVSELDQLLASLQLRGLVIRGDVDRARIGWERTDHFLDRVKSAMDPRGRFPE